MVERFDYEIEIIVGDIKFHIAMSSQLSLLPGFLRPLCVCHLSSF